jgi:hypothetical protein
MIGSDLMSRLAGKRHVLLAGAGGGYDVFGAVPLAAGLWARGQEVSFANVSFCRLDELAGAERHRDVPNLYAEPARAAVEDRSCPGWCGPSRRPGCSPCCAPIGSWFAR